MGERGKHVGSSLPLRWIALAAAPSPFRRVEALHADPLAPQRRQRNAEKTLLRRCFDYIALSIGDQVNLPRPQHERKSVVQLLIPLASPDRLHPAFFWHQAFHRGHGAQPTEGAERTRCWAP